jgi:transposase InsO family protein
MLWFWLSSFVISFKKPKSNTCRYRQSRVKSNNVAANRSFPRNRKKPPWVTNKVLYLKAISGQGCGKVAETFNRLHGDKETVSKSFVYEKLKNNQYQLKVIRRQIKNKPPRAVPINHSWGIDLTTVTLDNKKKLVLGIIDHGSRLNLQLVTLKSKHSASILIEICKTIRQFGLPKAIRSDNEACFTARTMLIAFKLLGIKRQRTDVASPWQDGRIERFFGTFKTALRQAGFENVDSLQAELDIFNILV